MATPKTYKQQERENLTMKESLIRLHKGLRNKCLTKDELRRLAIYSHPNNYDRKKYTNYAKTLVKKYKL